MERKPRGERVGTSNKSLDKTNNEGSQAPLGAGSQKTHLNTRSLEEALEEVSWNELANYALNYFEQTKGCLRKLPEILEINKILEVYEQSIIKERKPLINHPEFNPLLKIKSHMKLIKEGKFAWESIVEDLDELLAFLKPTVSKFFSSFDIQFGNHRTAQVLFPLKLIYLYLARVDRNYGKPVYDKTLRIQNCLAELFLYHHLKADTKFSPSLETDLLPGSSVELRSAVRRINRENAQFRKKYLDTEFNLKDVIFQWLDLYFPNVSWRYIGGGQELHRLILQTILTLFELGVWEPADMERLLITLFQKLENLAVLERRSYSDFLTSLQSYPLFINTLKEYFFECKEIVAAICLHIIYLTSDERIVRSPNMPWASSSSSSCRPYPILFRILTNYLLQFGGDSRDDQDRWKKRSGLRNKITRICALAGVETGDEYSRGGLGHSLHTDHSFVTTPKSKIQDLLDKLTSPNTLVLEADISQDISSIHHSLLGANVPNEEETACLDETKLAYTVNKIPSMLLGVLNFLRIRNNEQFSKAEMSVSEILINIASDNQTVATDMFSEGSIKLWESLIDIDPLLSLFILRQILIRRTLEMLSNNQNLVDQLLDLVEQATCKFKQIFAFSKSEQSAKSAASDWVIDKWISKPSRSASKKGTFTVGEEATVAGDKSDKISEMEVTSPIKSPDMLHSPASSALIQEITTGLLVHNLTCELLQELNQSMKHHSRHLSNTKIAFQIQDLLSERCFKFFIQFLTSAELWLEIKQTDTTLPITDPLKLTKWFLNSRLEPSQLSLTHSELRLLLINCAVSTVEVLANSTTGLFLHELYSQCGKEDGLLELIRSTEFFLQSGLMGLKARTAILKFVTNLLIFPGNGLLSNRLHEFNEGQGSNKENKIPPSHLTVATFSMLSTEIEYILKQSHPCPELHDSGYLLAFLLLAEKFLAGLYHRYTKDSRLDYLHKNVGDVCDKLLAIIRCCDKPTDSQSLKPSNKLRGLDSEERANPKLRELRTTIDGCLTPLQGLIASLSKCSRGDTYSRPSPATISLDVLEPWSEYSADKLLEEHQLSMWHHSHCSPDEFQTNTNKLFYEYDKAKVQTFFEKSENSLLHFLGLSESRIESFLHFFGKINDAYLSEAIGKKEVSPNDPDCLLNVDRIHKQFFKSEGIRWHVRFMMHALKTNPAFQLVYEKSLNSEHSSFQQSLTRTTLSCLRLWMDNLCSIVLNKTFFDDVYKQLKVEFLCLGEFFRVLTWENKSCLKKTLNQFAPKVPGIPHFNETQKGMCFNLYVRQETVAVALDVWKNNSRMLELSDRPEDFDLLITYARIVSEYCSGPCLLNQKEVYKYRGDTWFGIIGRQVDNLNSNLNSLRLTVIKGILSNLEGGDPDIATYYGSNCTFDHLMDLVYLGLKRLYIYLEYSQHGDKQQLFSLCSTSDATAKSLNKRQSVKEPLPKRKRSYDYYELESDDEPVMTPAGSMQENTETTQTDRDTVTERFDEEVVNEQMMKCIRLEDPAQVFETFKRNIEMLLKHPLYQVTEHLLQLITIISSRVPSFSICLDNANMKLLERYTAEQIPDSIKEKYKTHLEPSASLISDSAYTQRTETKDSDYVVKEKLLFYLVLTKVKELSSQQTSTSTRTEENRAVDHDKPSKIDSSSSDVMVRIESFLSDMQTVVANYKKAVTNPQQTDGL